MPLPSDPAKRPEVKLRSLLRAGAQVGADSLNRSREVSQIRPYAVKRDGVSIEPEFQRCEAQPPITVTEAAQGQQLPAGACRVKGDGSASSQRSLGRSRQIPSEMPALQGARGEPVLIAMGKREEVPRGFLGNVAADISDQHFSRGRGRDCGDMRRIRLRSGRLFQHERLLRLLLLVVAINALLHGDYLATVTAAASLAIPTERSRLTPRRRRAAALRRPATTGYRT